MLILNNFNYNDRHIHGSDTMIGGHMPPRTKEGSLALAYSIKQRRHELGLSAEEAARKAGVGTKTWFRYESGNSIRNDKIKGVCKALSWTSLPQPGVELPDCDDYAWLNSIDASHKAWSPILAEEFGRKAAVSFAVGSDILLDYLNDDLEELGKMPAGTHIGELDSSWLADMLPLQFLTRYDFEFVYRFNTVLAEYRTRARFGTKMNAHSPAEELLVRLIRDLSFDAIGEWTPATEGEAPDNAEWQNSEGWKEWPEDLCGDDDLSAFLYDTRWTSKDEAYHYDRWFEHQFYLDQR